MTSHAHAYISHSGRGIVLAAAAVNDAGIRYEPGYAALLPPSASPASVGQAVVDVLDRFCRKDRNLRDYKKTEWPAFRASGLKSVRAFEQEFSYVALDRDERRLTLSRFEQDRAAVDTVHLGPGSSPEDIGAGLIKIAQRAGFDLRSEPGASPNGGPAESSVISITGGAPPSVS